MPVVVGGGEVRVSPTTGWRHMPFESGGRETKSQAKRKVGVHQGGWTNQRKQEAETKEKREKKERGSLTFCESCVL